MLNYEFYWESAADGGVRLLRVLGMTPEVELPEEIEGRPLTEIGAYCFAERSHLPETYESVKMLRWEMWEAGEAGQIFPELREICGSYLKYVVLPDTVQRIGNLAFYNCTALTTLEIGSSMRDVGSDAFMNCRNLHGITLRCGAREKSGVRQILKQISSDMEVTFQGKAGVEAVLLFPDYYEGFDEITPAHVFGRKIEGEGFRARESFKNDIPDFAQYDQIFPKACVEESVGTLCRLAMNRLCYPVDLGIIAKYRYEEYIKGHADEICVDAIKKRDIHRIEFLCEMSLVKPETLETSVPTAAESGWVEGAAYLLGFKEKYFPQKAGAERYTFEEF